MTTISRWWSQFVEWLHPVSSPFICIHLYPLHPKNRRRRVGHSTLDLILSRRRPNELHIQGGPKNDRGRRYRLIAIILSYVNRFQKKISLKDSLVNVQLNAYKKIPQHLAYIAALPCKTLTSAKQAHNDKLQGSVAAYLRCGGLLITKLRKVHCWVCEWIF